VGVAEGVEPAREVLEEGLDVVVALLEVGVELVRHLAAFLARARVAELVGVHLGEALLRLGVLQLEVPAREELVRVDGDAALDVVELVVEDALLDQVLERRRRLLGDDGRDLAHALKLEVLLEERVDRPVLGARLALGRPLLRADVLLLERRDLRRQLEEAPLVPRQVLVCERGENVNACSRQGADVRERKKGTHACPPPRPPRRRTGRR